MYCVSEGSERSEGRRRVLGSLDEDDPNILLAIQLSLQESRRERDLDGGLEDRGLNRRAGSVGELVDVALHSLNTDTPLGAGGSSFPSSLLDPPRPPNRTDSTSQPPVSSSLPLPPPPPSLSAELLELGDSLLKLSSISTPSISADAHRQQQVCSQFTCGNSTLITPLTLEMAHRDGSRGPEQKALALPFARDHLSLTEHSYCPSSSYSETEQATSCAQISADTGSYNHDHLSLHGPKPDASFTPERPPDSAPKFNPQPPTHLCLPSPELEPELLLSPVIPPGRPFTPSDPQSLEALDPTASAQLLDNIMAWFNNNINPQNNPQSLALIPSPPTTETDSSPDTLTETESLASRDIAPVPPIWQPLEGEPGSDREIASNRLELDHRDSGEEGVDGGCVTDLSLDEVHTHPHSLSQQRSSPTHTAPVEEDQSPEEWEEQVHLV